MSHIPHSNRLTEFSIKQVTNTAVSRSLSGSRQALSYGGGYWELLVSFAPLMYEQAKETAAFLNSLQGRLGTFKLKLPVNITGNSNYSGNMLVNGGSQAGTQINVNGLSPDSVVLKAGDFIKFASSNKVYQVQKDLISDPSGDGVLDLHMPIVGSLPVDNERVLCNPLEVEFTVALTDDITEWSIDAFVRSQWSLSLEEVWG